VGLALAALACFASGCGGGEADPGQAAAAVAPVPAGPGELSRTELRVQLAEAFHASLRQLAVAAQPRDSAADLGQDLPTGTLDSVACEPRSCVVQWRQVGGAKQRTSYAISYFRGGCFSARAVSPLRDIYDSSVDSYESNPLSQIGGSRC
jgi:hypothetical protein